MKLILSTLALGTAAAAPMMQESGADAPQGTPLTVQTTPEQGQELHTAALAPVTWKLELATTAQDDQEDDEKELQEAAEALETELVRLRSELEAMRQNLAKERGQAVRIRGEAAMKKGDLEEARRAAIELSRQSAAAARDNASAARDIAQQVRDTAQAEAKNARKIAEAARKAVREAEASRGRIRWVKPDGSNMDAESIVEYATKLDKDARVFVMENVKHFTPGMGDPATIKSVKIGGDALTLERLGLDAKALAKVKGKGQGWILNEKGDAPKGLAWITDVEEDHGPDGHADHDNDHGSHGIHHDADGSTINIHVEHGDVHIHASGSAIHTSGGGSAKTHVRSSNSIFGKSTGKASGDRDIFGRALGGKVTRKVTVGGEEVEMPQGFFFDSDSNGDTSNFAFGFSGEIDLEDITEEIAEAMEGEFSEELLEEISEGLSEAFEDIEGFEGLQAHVVLEGLEGLAELKNLKGLQGLAELENLKSLKGFTEFHLPGRVFRSADDGRGFKRATVDGLESFVTGDSMVIDGESIEVKTMDKDRLLEIRVLVDGKEVPMFGEINEYGHSDDDCEEDGEEDCEEDCDEEEEEEEEIEEESGDDRFVWLKRPNTPEAPRAPRFPMHARGPGGAFAPIQAPASPTSAFAQPDGLHLAMNPTFPGVMAPRAPGAPARAAADAELAAIAREIREELRAMRAEIRELRTEVMRAPKAPASAPLSRRSSQGRSGNRR